MSRLEQGGRLFNPNVPSTTRITLPGQRVGITPTSTNTTASQPNPVIDQLQQVFSTSLSAIQQFKAGEIRKTQNELAQIEQQLDNAIPFVIQGIENSGVDLFEGVDITDPETLSNTLDSQVLRPFLSNFEEQIGGFPSDQVRENVRGALVQKLSVPILTSYFRQQKSNQIAAYEAAKANAKAEPTDENWAVAQALAEPIGRTEEVNLLAPRYREGGEIFKIRSEQEQLLQDINQMLFSKDLAPEAAVALSRAVGDNARSMGPDYLSVQQAALRTQTVAQGMAESLADNTNTTDQEMLELRLKQIELGGTHESYQELISTINERAQATDSAQLRLAYGNILVDVQESYQEWAIQSTDSLGNEIFREYINASQSGDPNRVQNAVLTGRTEINKLLTVLEGNNSEGANSAKRRLISTLRQLDTPDDLQLSSDFWERGLLTTGSFRQQAELAQRTSLSQPDVARSFQYGLSRALLNSNPVNNTQRQILITDLVQTFHSGREGQAFVNYTLGQSKDKSIRILSYLLQSGKVVSAGDAIGYLDSDVLTNLSVDLDTKTTTGEVNFSTILGKPVARDQSLSLQPEDLLPLFNSDTYFPTGDEFISAQLGGNANAESRFDFTDNITREAISTLYALNFKEALSQSNTTSDRVDLKATAQSAMQTTLESIQNNVVPVVQADSAEDFGSYRYVPSVPDKLTWAQTAYLPAISLYMQGKTNRPDDRDLWYSFDYNRTFSNDGLYGPHNRYLVSYHDVEQGRGNWVEMIPPSDVSHQDADNIYHFLTETGLFGYTDQSGGPGYMRTSSNTRQFVTIDQLQSLWTTPEGLSLELLRNEAAIWDAVGRDTNEYLTKRRQLLIRNGQSSD